MNPGPTGEQVADEGGFQPGDGLPGLVPIGDEPSEVSLTWARHDAEIRGLTIEQALRLRRSAFEDGARLAEQWDPVGVELEIEIDGEWIPASDAARLAGSAWLLLSAMNPFGEDLAESDNLERNRLLAAELDAPALSRGRALDGSWEERGFAVVPGRGGIDAAQRFAQAAVYLATPDRIETVFLVGAAPADLDRVAEMPSTILER